MILNVFLFLCILQSIGMKLFERFINKNLCVGPTIRVDNGGLIVSHREFGREPYNNDLDCEWIIIAPPKHNIMIQYDFLNVEDDKECNFDYIEYVNLEGENTKVCGNDDNKRYRSLRNKLTVKFHTDKNNNLEGFILRYWFVNENFLNTPLTKYRKTCVDNEWECKGEKSCIPKAWVCDKVRDCKDNSDESLCEFKRSCHQSQFKCRDDECFGVEKLCDKMPDCTDHSDESSCETPTLTKEFSVNNTHCGFQPLKPNNINITEDNPQIVGGEQAVPNSWPWMASLRFASSHFCGATLISRSWAVTASHCFENNDQPQFWQLDLGRHYVDQDLYSQRIQIAEIIRHPYYNSGTIENDIALLRLSKNATLTSKVQTLCVPKPNQEPVPQQRCVILGWGITHGTGGWGALKQAIVPIVERKTCDSYYDKVFPSMICAGYEKGGVDACQQDSGGPLICSVNGTLKLSGITSWGEGCAQPKKPGVYTNVASFIPWIKKYVHDLNL